MKKDKILIALFRLPYPLTDGTRFKVFDNVIQGLTNVYDLEFLITTYDAVSAEDIDYIERYYGKVHLFRKSKVGFFRDALRALYSSIPFQVAGYFNKKAFSWIRNNIHLYKAVYVHEIRMTEYFIRLSDTLRSICVVDFNDALSLHYIQASKKTFFPKSFMYRIEGKRVGKYESKVMRLFTYFNVASSRDREFLLEKSKMDAAHITFTAIPHGVHIPTDRASLTEGKNIFFIGNLDYAPNRDALRYFLTTFWEILKNRIPGVYFHIIGKGKPIESSLSDRRVRYHGFIQDLSSILTQMSLLVAPIRYGAGTPSKIIDAMAYGIPVLTTPIGAEGISGILYDQEIIVCSLEDKDEWINSIERIVSDKEHREKIGLRARSFISSHYSSHASQTAFRELFEKIIATKHTSSH